MLKNKKYKELAKQYINKYSLNLEGYNVLVPMMKREPFLPGFIAGMAGAGNIHVYNPAVNLNRTEGAEFQYKITGSVSEEILSNANIILKTSEMPLKDEKLGCFSKKDGVISILPDNLDFLNTQNINPETCNRKNIPVIALNPADPKMGLYQQFSHVIIKRLYNLGTDIFRSKILLIGNGDFLSCVLGILKSMGAVVYAYNTELNTDQSYVLKHLKELDSIIVMDYPASEHQIIGSRGLISICDLVDLCPLVNIIHICGNIEIGSLKLGNIACYPEEITQNSLNINIEELGERGIIEFITASFKAAEEFLKKRKKSLTLNDSVVSYSLVNAETSAIMT